MKFYLRNMKKNRLISLLILLGLGLGPWTVNACTTMVFSDQQGLRVAKNMDWPFREGFIVLHPRNINHTAKEDANHPHPIQWRSQYGSVVFHGDDQGQPGPSADGMNEKGLTTAIMVLASSEYPHQGNSPQLNIGSWSQYLLDNFQSVSEVIDHLNDYELWPQSYHQHLLKFHLYVNDAYGDSAIIEYYAGKAVIYKNNEISPKVLTNSFYHASLSHLKQFKRFGGNLPLPGEYDSLSRFVKASAYLKGLPKDISKEYIAAGFNGLGIAAQPLGEGMPTQSSMVFDIPLRKLYFRSINNAEVRIIDLNAVDFEQLDHDLIINPYEDQAKS